MVFDILTIFPGLCEGYLADSIIKREIMKGTIKVRLHDIRAYTKDKHKKVDDKPYGGGAGMLMTPQPILDCVKAVKKMAPKVAAKAAGGKRSSRTLSTARPVIYLSAAAKTLDHKMAQRLAKKKGLILLCGRYEGIDDRALKLCVDEEISIGNYVLTGGELPALVVVDAVTRLLPGALGNEKSAEEDSFTEALGGKKEYPHYTRPPIFEGLKVPPVLLTGDHAKIKDWRMKRVK